MGARRRPLDPPRRFKVRFHPKFLDEVADAPYADRLLVELDEVLSRDPFRPSGRRARQLADVERLWRYRPHCAGRMRVLYRVERDLVFVTLLLPRRSEYRKALLRQAGRRAAERRTGEP